MRRRNQIRTFAVALAVVVTSSLLANASAMPAVAADPRIDVIDLGVLGDPRTSSSSVVAMNERGQVIGVSSAADGFTRSFLWERGRMRELGTLAGGQTYVTAISDSGLVVGNANRDGVGPRAVVWREGEISLLPIGSNELVSEATAVNSRGDVAGTVIDAGHTNRAALWQNGRLTKLNPPGEWYTAMALDIDERGRVLVQVTPVDTDVAVYWLWDHGTFTHLAGLLQSPLMNAKGQVAGILVDQYSQFRPKRWTNGRWRDGGAFENAFVDDINERGDIIGTGSQTNSGYQQFIWLNEKREPTTLRNLDGAGLVAINNHRQMIASTLLPTSEIRTRPFLVQDGRSIALPGAWDGENRLLDINDRGDIIGTRISLDGQTRRATVWRVH